MEEGLPEDPAGRRAALLRLVREETARLDQRQAGHERREAADRAELADRLAVDTTAEGERMRRYQLDFDRKLHRALNTLLKLRRGEGVGVGGDPAPDGTPSPSREPVGTVELPSGPVDGPEGEADAEVPPSTENRGVEDEELGGRQVPGAWPRAGLFRPFGAVRGGVQRGASSDPAKRTHDPGRRQPIPQDDPGPPAHGDPIARNEPGPPAGGDPSSQNEPTGSGRIADLSAPALVCALCDPAGRPTVGGVCGPVRRTDRQAVDPRGREIRPGRRES